jgi:hypothetical protein
MAGKLYKQPLLSDVTVRIVQRSGSKRKVVDEFPGHKALFFSASEFFAALLKWKDDQCPGQQQSIDVCVPENQVVAARCLVYFVYHVELMADMATDDLASLILLADFYKITSCLRKVGMCLDDDDHSDAVHVVTAICSAVSLLPQDSTALAHMLQPWKNKCLRIQEKLEVLSPDHERFVSVIDALFAVFRELDLVWQKEEFRELLFWFPVDVVVALFDRKGFKVQSENVIVTAMDMWLRSRCTLDYNAKRSLALKLSSAVRHPFMTTNFLLTIFPKMWGYDLHKFTRVLPQHLANNNTPDRDYTHSPTALPSTSTSTSTSSSMQPPAALEFDISWQSIQDCMRTSRGDYDQVALPHAAWINGVELGIGLWVNSNAESLSNSPFPGAMGIFVEARHPLHDDWDDSFCVADIAVCCTSRGVRHVFPRKSYGITGDVPVDAFYCFETRQVDDQSVQHLAARGETVNCVVEIAWVV